MEKIRIKLETIEDDPTVKQIVGVIYDLLEIIDEKKGIGFKNEKGK